jgi:hypothetical protein
VFGICFGTLLRQNKEPVTEESTAMKFGEVSQTVVGLTAWQTTERLKYMCKRRSKNPSMKQPNRLVAPE